MNSSFDSLLLPTAPNPNAFQFQVNSLAYDLALDWDYSAPGPFPSPLIRYPASPALSTMSSIYSDMGDDETATVRSVETDASSIDANSVFNVSPFILQGAHFGAGTPVSSPMGSTSEVATVGLGFDLTAAFAISAPASSTSLASTAVSLDSTFVSFSEQRAVRKKLSVETARASSFAAHDVNDKIEMMIDAELAEPKAFWSKLLCFRF